MKLSLFQKVFYLSLLLLASSLVISCSGDSDNNSSPAMSNSSSTPSVEAVKSRYGALPLSERLSGTVYAKSQVSLYPEISGKISTVHVQNGEYVEKGEPIVSLEDSQYREQVEQARANLRINEARLKQARARYNELEAQYRRTKQLSDQELSSELEMETLQAQMSSAEADVDLAEAQVEQARSSLAEQQDMLSKTVIKAPISGTVGQRSAETGMQVSSSTQLYTIGDLDNLRVEVVLTDQMLDDIEVGQTARIYTSSNANNSDFIEAELSRISPFLNNITRSTEGEIDVQNTGNKLRPGMFVPVDILYGQSERATLVPTSAIYTDPNSGEEGVFVATSLGSEIQPAEQVDPENPPPLTAPTEVQFKSIDVIAEGRMEVGVEGIEPGNWVITVGQNLLSSGSQQARVRTSSWERILALQGLQRQDLLQRVLNRQTELNDSSSQ
ncbi:efflux transporter periplasmic adaptor subunit [Aliifodinibius salipaludis]|uniref:Efflux transporter periplasmic adaptor subunit n=1 Tax=Fodinibius salipaludis TaxID=2032627 RepID=A0A2A2GCX8_9BACT|nr:efflux RND transporter periplasmic adaptor subunit [Aliifodinibius salipaludis]PAU94729.1 efflux transporter periplasmic adaptor subunit [Aliifodinibius salipaludis]